MSSAYAAGLREPGCVSLPSPAADAAFKHNNAGRSPGEVDLHGLTVAQVVGLGVSERLVPLLVTCLVELVGRLAEALLRFVVWLLVATPVGPQDQRC
jgi:hypothetical protein